MDQLNVPDGQLRISWYTLVTDCLGSGERLAIWVQGCYKRCGNCIAKALQSTTGGELKSVAELAEEIMALDIDGISISGGEPFLQARGLAQLLRLVNEKRPELGVITYTGYLYEELKDDEDAKLFLSQIDILVDGTYVEELDDGAPMRGSSNQRVLFLTDRYSDSDLPRERKSKIIFENDVFAMIGIPSDSTKRLIKMFSSDKEK